MTKKLRGAVRRMRLISAVGIAVVAVASGFGISSVASASSSSSGPTPGPDARVAACTGADLGMWVAIDEGNGAAGSIYFPLEITNLSGHTCSLHGFPGVSAIDPAGRQLGSPASLDHLSMPRTVVLDSGDTAHAMFRWSDATVTTASECRPVSSTFALRVAPPDQRSATRAAFAFPACSHTGPVYMSVGPVVPGVGTVNG